MHRPRGAVFRHGRISLGHVLRRRLGLPHGDSDLDPAALPRTKFAPVIVVQICAYTTVVLPLPDDLLTCAHFTWILVQRRGTWRQTIDRLENNRGAVVT